MCVGLQGAFACRRLPQFLAVVLLGVSCQDLPTSPPTMNASGEDKVANISAILAIVQNIADYYGKQHNYAWRVCSLDDVYPEGEYSIDLSPHLRLVQTVNRVGNLSVHDIADAIALGYPAEVVEYSNQDVVICGNSGGGLAECYIDILERYHSIAVFYVYVDWSVVDRVSWIFIVQASVAGPQILWEGMVEY